MSYDIEGEFKRKIVEISHYLSHGGYNEGFQIRECDQAKFWDVFREAKKEFPLGQKFMEDGWGLSLAEARKQWFMKWFGDGDTTG